MPCLCNTACNCCSKLILSTNIALNSDGLIITIPADTNLVNLENYCLILTQSLPPLSETNQVFITNGTTFYVVQCKLGNYVRADQIQCRKKYHIVYGADPVHFTITDCLPRTGYVGSSETPSAS